MPRDPYEITVLQEDYEEKRADYLRYVDRAKKAGILSVVEDAEGLIAMFTAWVRLERARLR